MIHLQGHLPDKAFWDKVEEFIQMATKCHLLLDSVYERFMSVGEGVAPLQSPTDPEPNAYITASWGWRVASLALNPELGIAESGDYYHQRLPNGDLYLTNNELIYV